MLKDKLMQVIALSMLLDEGTKIARLSGNRNFDEKVVKSKMKSMKANGMLVPAIIVDAKMLDWRLWILKQKNPLTKLMQASTLY